MFKKSVLSLVFGLVLAAGLARADESLNECGLPESMEVERIVDLPGAIHLYRATRQDINELDSLSRQQLVIAARVLGWEEIEGTWLAVERMRNASEASDLDIMHFRVGRGRFTAIRYYPGGNEAGVIFRKGGRTPIATIGDSSIACL